MANKFFTVANAGTGGAPITRTYIGDASATFIRGAAVLIDTDGEIIECSADPAVILGFTAAANLSAPGYDAANSPTVITGRQNDVVVYLGEPTNVFACRAVNGSTDPVTPALTNIGESYGIKKDANGVWTLDIAEVTSKSFTVVDVDIDQKIFYVKMVQSFYQLAVAA